MLRVAPVRDAAGRYYLADLASGRWFGRGAAELGLLARPDAATFGSVMRGEHPRTGRGLAARTTQVRAYDLTFAAPKSVSVLFALGDEGTAERVIAAHRGACAAALAYLEAKGASVRMSGAERRPEAVRGIVAAVFDHVASRTLDPHLHSHAVVANVARGHDGRWRAIDGRGVYAHARAAGNLYDAHLRRLLVSDFGLDWAARRSGAYELAVVDPVLVGVFSRRQSDIRAHLFAHGGSARFSESSAKARAVAWAVTCEDKTAARSLGALRREWHARAAAAGLSLDVVAERRRHGDQPRVPCTGGPTDAGQVHAPAGRVDEHRFRAALYDRERSGAARRDVVAAWAGSLRLGAAADAVNACVASLAPWPEGVGVAEGLRPVAPLCATSHHLVALGPRPDRPDALATWLSAAADVDRFRSRWGVDDPSEPLGVPGSPSDLAAMPARRLADHLSAARSLEEARRRLGLTIGRDVRRDSLVLGR